ncbi:MAG: transcriptional regulator [Elusimicrobia bacterium RIFOXYA12_FULL_51_18]|nr:MAG: transcriptional regulator [Elusimicrobia bacterium RIFOXYA12_FULL_51_18]OGS28550.1 MAG: transcriptional regulator [Elusimicrobia bacterium RIFOXYA2_FULL_53_38]
MKDIRILYGEKLKDFRKKQGLSQEELGFKSSLHRTYISEVERGRRNISIVNIARIAKALGLPIRDFFE